MKVCIVGALGKLVKYMVQHALERSYEVVGVCREQSVGKLDEFKGRITVISADIRKQNLVDPRTRERPRRGKKSGAASMESACG